MSTGVFVRPSPAPAPQAEPSRRRVSVPEPFTLVIFGATGDLTARKLLPALYGLWHGRFLPDNFAVIGVGRREKNDEEFRNDVRNAVAHFATICRGRLRSGARFWPISFITRQTSRLPKECGRWPDVCRCWSQPPVYRVIASSTWPSRPSSCAGCSRSGCGGPRTP